jgi:probable HAF family extracellular repeat protein
MASFLLDRDSIALAISENGSFIGGRIRTDTGSRAYRWSEAQGMQLLSDLGGPFSQAEAVTDDGSVIAGSSSTAGGPNVMYRAVRWLDGQIQDLGSFAGYPSYATGMSNDGQVVVGGAVNADGYFRAFRWTQQSGIEYIASAESLGAFALDVSADGSVVVGTMYLPNNRQRAFRWTRQAGMQTVEDWLRSRGAVVPEDITKNATGVSADGTAVVGELIDFTGFLAIEPEIKLPQPVPAFKNGWLLALLIAVFWSGVAHRQISGTAR